MEHERVMRSRRFFAPEFKKRMALQISRSEVTIAEVSRAYKVGRSVIYRWIRDYSPSGAPKPAERYVLECDSDTRRALQAEKLVKELQAVLGRKQFEIEALEHLIDLASDRYGDLKKVSDRAHPGLPEHCQPVVLDERALRLARDHPPGTLADAPKNAGHWNLSCPTAR